jgi:SPP1 family predicted phage head-tail adaptor
MRERITIKSRTYTTSTTGQRSFDTEVDVLTTWADIYQRRRDFQDLTGTQNVLEGDWVFRIRNAQLEVPISKSNFIFWRDKEYSITSISAQESYQRMIDVTCRIIE